MGLKSFRQEEQEALATTPNAMSLARGIGGLVLGVMLGMKGIDPETALATTAALAATDMEGLVITATNRMPRLQRILRIIPSAIGRKLDPVMDKVFAVPILAGAMMGDYMPAEESVSIIGTEVTTAGLTVYANRHGTETETSKIGTWGTVARFATLPFNLAAKAFEHGVTHDIMFDGGIVSAVGAFALGSASAYDIHKQHQNNMADQAALPRAA